MVRWGAWRWVFERLLVLSVLVTASTALAAEPSAGTLADYDRKITDELRALAPDAVAPFEEANRARTGHQPDKAVELYQKVLAKAPEFSHARRRLCHELLELGRRDDALRECRKAAEDKKAVNLAGLASALISPEGKHVATPDEIREAKALSDQATELEPNDPFVWYARCQVALREQDLPMLERATGHMEGGPPDLLASALLMRASLFLSSAAEPSEGDLREAKALAERAEKLAPDEPQTQLLLCQIAVGQNDPEGLKHAVAALSRLAPDDPRTHVYACFLAMGEGRWSDARRSLERAHALGLDDETYAGLSKGLAEAQPFWVGLIRPVLWTLGLWFAALVLLVSLGLVLSHVALRESERLPEDRTERTGRAQGMTASLRRAYAVVLWMCSAFYYVSIPLVVVVVLGTAAALVIGMLMAGIISIKLLVIGGIVVMVTLSALAKSLFVRPRDEDPGERLDLEKQPRLAQVLQEVAKKIETRPVDTVFITPGTEIAVFERGGLSRQIRGNAERCLILGAGVLEGMKQRELKAILAHEYGHFSNRDTAGGGFAIAVRRSLALFAIGLAQGGAATWFNPAWWFINGFYRVFLRISQGASRLQEVLADRFAAFAYGSEAFVTGLRHVVERSIRFDVHCDATIKDVIERQQPLANLYRFTPTSTPTATEIDEAIREAFEKEPSAFDSHPALKDRIRWVTALAAEGENDVSGDADAWSLFEDRDAIEAELTAQVRYRLAEQGVVVRPA